MLGNSETIGKHQDIFQTISKKWRIFQRIDSALPRRLSFPILTNRHIDRLAIVDEETKKRVRFAELVNQTLLDQFAPAAILVNRKHEILYHFGNTFEYLRHPTGETTSDLYRLCRDGLISRIRGALHKAIKDEEKVTVTGARVKRNEKYVHVMLSVIPLKEYEGGRGFFLVCFKDQKQRDDRLPEVPANILQEEEPLVKQLEYELNATKEDLQNTIEELETSNEELKVSNEEAMSMNEELQSSNEELETSKEELQSLNEELNTVNSELQDKILCLEASNNDLTNLINSTNIAAIFLNTKFHINFFSPASKKLFKLIPTDTGRSLDDISPRFKDKDLHRDNEEVLDHLRISEKEIQNDEGEWFNRKIQPYRTQDNRIEGTVITFENITKIKQGQQNLVSERDLNRLYFNLAAIMILAIDKDGLISMINSKACEILGYEETELLGQDWFSMCLPKESRSEARSVFDSLMTGKIKTLEYFENEVLTKWGEKRLIAWHNTVAWRKKGIFDGTIASGEDVTETRKLEKEFQEKQRQMQFETEILNKTQKIAHIGNWHLDIEKDILTWSDEIYRIFGLTPQEHEATYEAFLDACHPDDREMVEKAYTHSIKTKTPYECVYRICRPDGKVRIVFEKSEYIVDDSGKSTHSYGMIQDITEFKDAEKRLLTIKKKLSSVA